MTPEEHKRIVDDALKSLPIPKPAESTESERIIERFFDTCRQVRNDLEVFYEKEGRVVLDRTQFALKAQHLLLERLHQWNREELLLVLVAIQGWAITQEF